jgi:C-terminal processing protease CtpA/Prc
MRQNGGGDFFEGRKHLIQPLKQRSSVSQKGRLFVITGRNTASAAMANAIDFRKELNAILVGEPTGERPNSY